jgi:acyl-coenzyme A thioesterase PaaI-like protein
MDAIKGFLFYPVYAVATYLRFVAGVSLVLVPSLFRIIFKGPKSLKKFTALFEFLSAYPLGVHVFSGIVCYFAPYTASIGSTVRELVPGKCIVTMPDLPWLQNPFNSLHAIALSNLGEFASGTCMLSAMQHAPKGDRYKGIVKSISTEYFKKARGTIRAEGVASIEGIVENCDKEVHAYLYDETDTLVAKVTVTWSIKVQLKKNK